MNRTIRNITSCCHSGLFKAVVIMMFAIAAAIPMSTAAQNHIAKVVDGIQDKVKNGLILIEKRNPKSKKVYDRRLVIRWVKDAALAKRLQEAIKKDVSNSVSYNNIDNRVINIEFDTKKVKSAYQFVFDGDTWMLTSQQVFLEYVPE